MTRPYVVTVTYAYRVDAVDADDAVNRAEADGRLMDMSAEAEPDGWPATWTRDGLTRREVAR